MHVSARWNSYEAAAFASAWTRTRATRAARGGSTVPTIGSVPRQIVNDMPDGTLPDYVGPAGHFSSTLAALDLAVLLETGTAMRAPGRPVASDEDGTEETPAVQPTASLDQLLDRVLAGG